MTPDQREHISRMEVISYIESLLPELVVLAASQPALQAALKDAHDEARAAVRSMAAVELEGPKGGAAG